jgi:hypothetical protein
VISGESPFDSLHRMEYMEGEKSPNFWRKK